MHNLQYCASYSIDERGKLSIYGCNNSFRMFVYIKLQWFKSLFFKHSFRFRKKKLKNGSAKKQTQKNLDLFL